jgi:hypothetical protein
MGFDSICKLCDVDCIGYKERWRRIEKIIKDKEWVANEGWSRKGRKLNNHIYSDQDYDIVSTEGKIGWY